jgi:hypothetical protein
MFGNFISDDKRVSAQNFHTLDTIYKDKLHRGNKKRNSFNQTINSDSEKSAQFASNRKKSLSQYYTIDLNFQAKKSK